MTLPSPAAPTHPFARRPVRAIAVAAIAAALLSTQPLAAVAAPPTVSTPADPIAYVEQAAPVSIGTDIVLSGGSGYGGGYIDFGVAGGTADETLSLLSATSADTTQGAVTIVDGTVYLGNGGGADVIGTVNPARTGANGALRIDFVSPFTNPSFEGGSTIQGWTAIEGRVDLGVTTIAGYRSIDQSSYAGIAGGSGFNAPADDNTAPANATYTVRLSTAAASDGTTSLELTSDMTTTEGCDVVHGPAVFSDPFEAAQNDKIYFDWRAYQGSDNFHVYGYILNTATGAQTPVLNATGGNEVNAFVTKETVIPATGTYRFVFVGGTQDRTCGRAAGATLLIDNVRVYGTKVNDGVVALLADKVRYANSSDDPAATRTIAVTVGDNTGAVSSAGTVTVQITAVDDAPVFAPVPPITLTNVEGPQTYPVATGRLDVVDPDSPVTAAIVDATPRTQTIGGIAYTHAKTGTYGTLYIDEATGRYAFVPDADAVDARTTDDSESFDLEITAPDLSPGGPHPAKTARRTLTVAVDIPATGPGATSATSATAGHLSAQVQWTAPAWTAGSPLTGYRVEQSTDGGDTWTTAVADTGTTATSIRVDDLAAGTPVVFRVAGINANGVGTWGTASPAVSPFTTPAAPSPASAAPGDGSAQLTWTAPVDGGSPVTGYLVEQSVDGGDTWTVVVADTGTTVTSRAVTGLQNGVPAVFRVSALNAAGASPAASSAPVTPRTTPGRPRALTAVPEDGTVSLAWAAPDSDGGAPITGYLIEQSVDGGDTWTVVIADTGTADPAYTVTGLANGTPASFRVSALNEAGAGPAADASATPRRPAGPVTIDGVVPGNRTLTVSFTPPADDGGSPVTAYEYSIDGGTTWLLADGVSSPLVIEGLTNGAPHGVLLRAVNGAGAGSSSAPVTGTPVLQPIRADDGSLPLTAPGQGASTLSGAPERSVVHTGGTTWALVGDDFEIRVTALDADGSPVPLSSGSLLVPTGGSLRVTGSGFQPGSTADLWLIGAGILLGEPAIGPDGTFASTFVLPAGVELGPDTLQVNGLDPSGAVRSVVMGLTVVSPEAAALATTGGDLVVAGVAGGLSLLLLIAGGWLLLVRAKGAGAGRSRS